MIDMTKIVRMNALFARDVTAAPAKVTAAVRRAASVVAGPSFVVAFAANFPFEVSIVVSPVMR